MTYMLNKVINDDLEIETSPCDFPAAPLKCLMSLFT